MGLKKITDQEIKYIIEKAESHIDSRDFIQAIGCYSQLIENTTPHPYFFKRRGFCHRITGNADKAIEDYTTAIKLDPDDGTTYWELAPCYSYKISHEGIVDENERKDVLEKSLDNYKAAVERIPTSPEAWLNIIETCLRLFEFDDAISNYGSCKPYIDTKEYQLVRSWLGCLALTFAGDPIEEEDEKHLNDQSIRLRWNHWAFYSIDILFKELEQKGFDSERLEKSKEIHQKFVDHFDEQPLRFNKDKIKIVLSDQEIKYLVEKAEAYVESRDFEQALKSYNQIIENTPPHPHYFKKSAFCHRMMGNMDKAIDNYNAALNLDPDDGVTYWERGACYNDKPYQEGIVDENKKKNLLEKALRDYKSSLERIPTSQEAWLAIIDIDLCLFKFDDAISVYGACNPYIHTREYQVIRSWYGCLALTFAGDPIEEEDEKHLNDQSIRLRWNHWAFYSIDILFKELEQKGFDSERLEKSKEIHQKFVDHFDEQPLRFNKDKIKIVLSDQEIKYLVEKAEAYVESRDFEQALKCYDQIIGNTPPHPHYFKKRAWAYRMMGEFNNAINDMNKAIGLDPDDGNSYWERGACYAHKLSLEKNIEGDRKKQMLGKILTNYKASVERNPTSPEAWLAVLETDMLLHNWDDAISNYGACKPYIDTKEYQLVRSWLGCLALTFAGDSHEEEDKTPLYNKNVRLKRTHWCVSEIDSLLIELENEGFDKERINKAKEFHQEFLDHFDEPPLRFSY